MRLYVASSWKNEDYYQVLSHLISVGHTVWDWREPPNGDPGFSWKQSNPDWKPGDKVTTAELRALLDTEAAKRGFANDMRGMIEADTGILLLPCGRSAHVEAGLMRGWSKPVYVLRQYPDEPDLLYRAFTAICGSVEELLTHLEARS